MFYQGKGWGSAGVSKAGEGEGERGVDGEGAPAGSFDEVRVNVNAQHAERGKVVHSSQCDDPLIAADVQAALAIEPAPVQHLQEAAHTSDRHAATQQAFSVNNHLA